LVKVNRLFWHGRIRAPGLRLSSTIWLAHLWAGWQEALAFVQPHTVLAWQRQCFRNYWRRFHQGGKPGRPLIAKELRDLIRKMSQANPTWGLSQIVGELRKLGIDAAKSTVDMNGEQRDNTYANLPVDGCDRFSGPTGKLI
jgi:hypothetical protein